MSATTDELLSGIHLSRWSGARRGTWAEGQEQGTWDAFARTVGEANEADARQYAEGLVALVRVHPQLQELATRLERFLGEPTTIADQYWQESRSFAAQRLG